MNQTCTQRGLTFVSFLLVCALVGLLALIGMKLFPLYMEKFKVIEAMHSVANQEGVARMGTREIHKALLRNFAVQDVDRFDSKNLGQYLSITKDPEGRGRIMTMEYESRTELTDELDVVLKFSYSVNLAGAGDLGEGG